MNRKIQRHLVLALVGLLFIVLAVSVNITKANSMDHMKLLSESIKSNLISISIAARNLIDIEKFYSYNSIEDIYADIEAYEETHNNLRSLYEMAGATFVYALKRIDDSYYFIFDTDPENLTIEDIFIVYDDISYVHFDAFNGNYSAGIMNVVDQWGSYNTGAIPIWRDGEIIGIVSTDIEDEYIRASKKAATRNTVSLIVLLTMVMVANIIIISNLIISPLRKLTDSVSKTSIDTGIIYGEDRKDEIGELARKIHTMTSDLESTIKKAQAASEAKSSFLANMSHEIRTPMNAIIGMTNIGKSAHSMERKDYALGKIESASTHLLGIINDILDMSKIEANKLELYHETFVFEELLKKAINIIIYRIVEKHQKFSLYIDEKIPQFVISDEKRLAQVITNLLSNAVKFTPEHGMISLNTKLLKNENDTCVIQFSISDTGVGISEEHLARLFNPFEQAESSITRKYGGTGLGLTLTKRIVELMGGSIFVSSVVNEGSTFTFTIKIRNSCKTVDARPLSASIIDMEDIKILIVDDDEDIRDYFVDIAMRFNIKCDTAANGDEAIALLKNGNVYDIYFVDWMMPGMNGIELSQHIKQIDKEKQHCDVSTIIMISSVEWQHIESDAKDAGVAGFLPKPIFPSDFIDCVKKCFGIDLLQKGNDEKFEKADSFWGYRVLLVEDIEINREIVTALLEPTFLEIDCAANGAEAVKMFNKSPEKYNIIFMDLQMPEMDGYEATRMIRSLDHEKAKSIPIIAMTANVFKDDIENCFAAGMNDHIGKPLDFGMVLNILRQYLFKQKPVIDRRLKNRRKERDDRRQKPDRRIEERRKR
ncbi:MAG: response regulator [Treponema sp.]|jgi:signal transduction histidine kinase/CheY-like chemotaxis protein|nr:response regulator [Treponema sp.]